MSGNPQLCRRPPPTGRVNTAMALQLPAASRRGARPILLTCARAARAGWVVGGACSGRYSQARELQHPLDGDQSEPSAACPVILCSCKPEASGVRQGACGSRGHARVAAVGTIRSGSSSNMSTSTSSMDGAGAGASWAACSTRRVDVLPDWITRSLKRCSAQVMRVGQAVAAGRARVP